MTVFQLLHWNGSLKAMRERQCSRQVLYDINPPTPPPPLTDGFNYLSTIVISSFDINSFKWANYMSGLFLHERFFLCMRDFSKAQKQFDVLPLLVQRGLAVDMQNNLWWQEVGWWQIGTNLNIEATTNGSNCSPDICCEETPSTSSVAKVAILTWTCNVNGDDNKTF